MSLRLRFIETWLAFNAALSDKPLIVEWVVVAVDMTRNVAFAVLRDGGDG